MPDRILVINPNFTDAAMRAIDDAMARLRLPGVAWIDLRHPARAMGLTT